MELPTRTAVMTLPATGPAATLFPQALLPLYIFEPRYRRMLADALKADRMFSVAMQMPGRSSETPCAVAGLGLIRVSVDHDDGTSHLILQGITRIELGEQVQQKPYRVHAIRPLQPEVTDSIVIDALVAKVHELVGRRLEVGGCPFPFPPLKKSPKKARKIDPKDVMAYLESLPDADQVADLVSCALLPGPLERQIILETVELDKRLKHLIHFLMDDIARYEAKKSK